MCERLEDMSDFVLQALITDRGGRFEARQACVGKHGIVLPCIWFDVIACCIQVECPEGFCFSERDALLRAARFAEAVLPLTDHGVDRRKPVKCPNCSSSVGGD